MSCRGRSRRGLPIIPSWTRSSRRPDEGETRRGRLPSHVSRCLANLPRRQGRMTLTLDSRADSRVATAGPSHALALRRKRNADRGKDGFCQVTPGAPISVQRRGRTVPSVYDCMHGCGCGCGSASPGWSLLKEVVRAGGRTGKQAMQICSCASCACMRVCLPGRPKGMNCHDRWGSIRKHIIVSRLSGGGLDSL